MDNDMIQQKIISGVTIKPVAMFKTEHMANAFLGIAAGLIEEMSVGDKINCGFEHYHLDKCWMFVRRCEDQNGYGVYVFEKYYTATLEYALRVMNALLSARDLFPEMEVEQNKTLSNSMHVVLTMKPLMEKAE